MWFPNLMAIPLHIDATSINCIDAPKYLSNLFNTVLVVIAGKQIPNYAYSPAHHQFIIFTTINLSHALKAHHHTKGVVKGESHPPTQSGGKNKFYRLLRYTIKIDLPFITRRDLTK